MKAILFFSKNIYNKSKAKTINLINCKNNQISLNFGVKPQIDAHNNIPASCFLITNGSFSRKYSFSKQSLKNFTTQNENKPQDRDGSYTEAKLVIEEQYKLIRLEKEKILNSDKSFILNFENNHGTNNIKSYELNYKCISYSKPDQTRIKYTDRSKNWLEIYLSHPRTMLIKEILDSIENKKHNKLFFHGGAGIGKTHILLDAVARARFRYLQNNFDKIPNRLIFYFLINQKNISQTLPQFCKELLFSCYPVLKYEQNILNSNQLEELFIHLFNDNGRSVNYEIFWEKAKNIFTYISTNYKISFFIILDQIDQIKGENKVIKNKFMWMEETLDEATVNDVTLRCASNNNETMREIYVADLNNDLGENTKILKLRGANFDENMIEFKLKEKQFPPEIASRYSKDFLALTNSVPLFVQMIPEWNLKIKNPECLKFYASNDTENDEENLNLDEKTFNFPDDPIFTVIDKELNYVINKTSDKIKTYIKSKVNKFKEEHYNKFDLDKKKKFKDVLLSLESRLLELKISEYADCVDYQLMEYDLVENNQGSMRIRSDYPDIVNQYKEIMKIELDSKDEINLYINEMISHIYNNNPNRNLNFNSLAGHIFERVVKLFFLQHKDFGNESTLEELKKKIKNFHLYDSLFIQEDLEMNALSEKELYSMEFQSKLQLPDNHILNNKTISPYKIREFLLSNLYFYNDFRSTPIIDGGLIYFSSGYRGIITYDATVGEKDWYSMKNIQLEKDQLDFYMEKYPLKRKSIMATNLIKVIAKLEIILPKTFKTLFHPLSMEFKFEKHLVIVPNLKDMIDAYENDIRFEKVKKLSNLEALKDFQDKMKKKIKNMAQILEVSPALKDKFEIAIINIRPVMTNDGKEIFEIKMFKYESKNERS